MATSAARQVFQLKVTIERIEPPVWRRVLVPGSMTLARLHKVIQELFDWWDYHLHEYEVDGRRYGIDDGEGWEPPLDERKVKLEQVVSKGQSFVYVYGFGDNWRHLVDVEDVQALDASATYPRCVGGERARPPEDVGGVGGYEEFLEAISDPLAEEHDSMLTWVGGSFDPEARDLLDINARLTPVRRR